MFRGARAPRNMQSLSCYQSIKYQISLTSYHRSLDTCGGTECVSASTRAWQGTLMQPNDFIIEH